MRNVTFVTYTLSDREQTAQVRHDGDFDVGQWAADHEGATIIRFETLTDERT